MSTTYRSSNRRHFMYQLGSGAGCLVLSWLLHNDRLRADTATNDNITRVLSARQTHFPARAKRVIYLIMEGGPSQIDTFDPKSALDRLHGSVFARQDVKTNQVRGKRFFVRSPYEFKRHGQCGMEVSQLFSETASCVDDMAFVRSVYADSDNHPAALFQYNTGFPVQGNPSVGAWVVYGLGAENASLPAFVVLRNGKPFGGTSSWANGYLPAQYQGEQFRSGSHPVLNLQPPEGVTRDQQRMNLELIQKLNHWHRQPRNDQSDLDARIAAYELAFRMQAEIPRAVDLNEEPEHIRRMYGLNEGKTKAFGTRCLLARRLVEQGVRFVQVWSGGWDSHGNVKDGHAAAAVRVDRPIAGLLKDLKQRGLLDETLVVWGGEFGRTPDTTQAAWDQKKPGRDHNPRAMTMWFAGGGIKGGTTVGSTDEFGEAAAEQPYHLHDVHATLLHLLGLEHTQLTYYHGGRFKRLTDVGGRLISGILG